MTPPFTHSKPSNIWRQLTDSNPSTPTSSCAKKHSCYLFRSTFVLFICLLFNIVKCVPPSYGSQSRCGFHIQWVCYLCCPCGYLLLLHLCSGSTVVWIISYFIMLTCSLGQEYGQGRMCLLRGRQHLATPLKFRAWNWKVQLATGPLVGSLVLSMSVLRQLTL